MKRNSVLAASALLAAACATTAPVQPASAQAFNSNAIQPETTISLTGEGTSEQAPDMASISVGVSVESETASAAMDEQSRRMNAVFAAVKQAGVADRDMQTSNISLNPVYDYSNDSQPRIRGYNASNQITIRVRNLDKLGQTLDAIVKAGGNQINGISFGVERPQAALDKARADAIADAARKAKLYADASGYRIKRIVTINENGSYAPQPQYARMMAMDAESASPIAAGELTLTASVNVVFELIK